MCDCQTPEYTCSHCHEIVCPVCHPPVSCQYCEDVACHQSCCACWLIGGDKADADGDHGSWSDNEGFSEVESGDYDYTYYPGGEGSEDELVVA
jgi:hypothetical protein